MASAADSQHHRRLQGSVVHTYITWTCRLPCRPFADVVLIKVGAWFARTHAAGPSCETKGTSPPRVYTTIHKQLECAACKASGDEEWLHICSSRLVMNTREKEKE